MLEGASPPASSPNRAIAIGQIEGLIGSGCRACRPAESLGEQTRIDDFPEGMGIAREGKRPAELAA
jgi:hypothetical protein